MKVLCDRCQEDFEISSIETRKVEKDIEENFFTCPKCKATYIVGRTNSKTRKLQEEIMRLDAKIKSSNKPKFALTKDTERLKYLIEKHKEEFWKLNQNPKEGEHG